MIDPLRLMLARAIRSCLPPLLAGAMSVSYASAAGTRPGGEALDYAFRFASAIQTDPKDKAKAQELVIAEYVSIGALDVAIERAGAIEGWRRGIAYADLATVLAKKGRADEARKLVAMAEAVRQTIKGWENPRISAHVVQALAILGDVDTLTGITAELSASDPRQYKGSSAATVASAHAGRGEFDKAMEGLSSLEGDDDFEAAWWRTAGYLAVARQASLPREKRMAALDAARTSASRVAGWKRAEALESIAEEYRIVGRRDRALEALEAASAVIAPLSPDSSSVAPLLSNLARAWAKHGEEKRARELLKQAEPLADRALAIDRPGVYGNIASSYHQLGDAAETRRLYERALASAAALDNARPRALAVTAICRQMGRHGYPVSEDSRARLDALLGGLKDPW